MIEFSYLANLLKLNSIFTQSAVSLFQKFLSSSESWGNGKMTEFFSGKGMSARILHT